MSSPLQGPPFPWPFIAVLHPGGGLGCVLGERLLTAAPLASINREFSLADGPDQRYPLDFTVRGKLAVASPIGLTSGRGARIVPARLDEECVVAARRGARVIPVRAVVTSFAHSALRVRVQADRRDDVRGSPVVNGTGQIVGLLESEPTDGELSAIGWVPLQQAWQPAPELSPAAQMTFAYALTLVQRLSPATAVLLGALRFAPRHTTRTVAVPLVELAAERTGLGVIAVGDATLNKFVAAPPRDPSDPVDSATVLRSPLAEILDRATVVREIVGDSPQVHLRHVLSAVLALDESAFVAGLFESLGVPLDELRSLFRNTLSAGFPEQEHRWRDLLQEARPSSEFSLAGGVSSDSVDPTKGIALETDHLGVADYVTMFATVIAEKKTPMPLSIGLFGEWGSGKSYFMGLLREQVAALSSSGEERFYGDIVQIGFNAWHYADSNLWASLGDEIFEQLAGSDEPRSESLREALADRVHHRKDLADAAERARKETSRLSRELDDAIVARRSSAGVLARAALETPAVKGQLSVAYNRLGVREVGEQSRLLAEELNETPADIEIVRLALWNRRGVWLLLIAIAVVGLFVWTDAWQWLLGGGAAAFAAVGWIVTRVRSGVRVLHDAADRLRHETDAAVAEERANLREAESRERVVQAQLDEVEHQIGEIGRELSELAPGQRLYRFIAERARSQDYRGHLGLISTIRRDFEQLIELMDDWRGADDDGTSPKPMDRIVLYIDDLDRCSPRQVVDVLQAVHLLLALDLFVVVVGVDPRWLLHALRSEYSGMLTDGGEDASAWQTTPQDYLEKIFNIPFVLPRMTSLSFQRLVHSVVDTEAISELEPVPAPSAGDSTPESDPTLIYVDPPSSVPVEANSEIAAVNQGAPPPVVRGLTPSELRLLSALAPLVDTPRETKRLLNLYRMIRATRDLTSAASFLGGDGPGEYEAVVVLLGLLSGHARLLEDVLLAPPAERTAGGLAYRDPNETWQRFVQAMQPVESDGEFRNDVVGTIADRDVREWRRLTDGIREATFMVTLPDLEAFQRWAPRVARFSFLLAGAKPR